MTQPRPTAYLTTTPMDPDALFQHLPLISTFEITDPAVKDGLNASLILCGHKVVFNICLKRLGFLVVCACRLE